jgi:hypothetical protein
MAFEQRDNSGALFGNEDKTTDTQPNARGRCKIDGRDYFVAAWTKTSQTGVRYQSLGFTAVDDNGKAKGGPVPFDDDWPF